MRKQPATESVNTHRLANRIQRRVVSVGTLTAVTVKKMRLQNVWITQMSQKIIATSRAMTSPANGLAVFPWCFRFPAITMCRWP